MDALSADARFLKRILVILIAATIATGAAASVATFRAELANRVATVASASIEVPDLHFA
jgi:hypothetical protein